MINHWLTIKLCRPRGARLRTGLKKGGGNKGGKKRKKKKKTRTDPSVRYVVERQITRD